MSRTFTIKVDEQRNENGAVTHGATVTEIYAGQVFTSFYEARSLKAAISMAEGLAVSLRKSSHSGAEIQVYDLRGGPIEQRPAT